MNKPILLACCLVIFAACAQAPQKPSLGAPATSEVSPLVVSGNRELDLEAKEPKGLLLEMDGEKPEYLRVEWGATRQALSQAIASLSGQPAESALTCSAQGSQTRCLLDEETTSWSGVLGEELSLYRWSPTLLFSPKGEFCSYMLIFPSDSLDALRSAFQADLGLPFKSQTNSNPTVWLLPHVSVALQPSSMGSQVYVVYTPIVETTQ